MIMFIQKYLVPWMGFNLWEFELRVVGVHAFNLLPSRSAQDLHRREETKVSFNEARSSNKPPFIPMIKKLKY